MARECERFLWFEFPRRARISIGEASNKCTWLASEFVRTTPRTPPFAVEMHKLSKSERERVRAQRNETGREKKKTQMHK